MKEAEERKNRTVINHWNRREYLVVGETDKEVTLRRSDGSEFTIARREYHFSYRDGKDSDLFRTSNNYSSDCPYEGISHNRR